MKRLLCLIIGHGRIVNHADSRGAAWATCKRCGAVVASHSFHGGRPWEKT